MAREITRIPPDTNVLVLISPKLGVLIGETERNVE